MSILETFYFVFDSDASKLKQGVDESEKGSSALEKSLKSTDSSAENLGESFLKLANNAKNALAAILAVGGITAFTKNTADTTAGIYAQAQAMNISVETVSAYQNAIRGMGGTAETATGTLSRLRDEFAGMLEYGETKNEAFYKWQNTFKFAERGNTLPFGEIRKWVKDPVEALGVLSDAFEKLQASGQKGYDAAFNLSKMMGLSFPEFQTLIQGNMRFQEIIRSEKELGVTTKEMGELAKAFVIETDTLGKRLTNLSQIIVSPLLPTFKEWLANCEKLVGYFREHKEWGTAAYTAIGIAAAGAAVLLALPALVAIAPWVALGAAIALIKGDLDGYAEGMDSVIGRAMEKWPILGKIVQSVAEIVGMSVELMKSYFKALGDWLISGEALQPIKDFGKTLSEHIGKNIDLLGEKFPLLKKLADITGMTEAWEKWGREIKKIVDYLFSFQSIKDSLDFVGKWLGQVTGGNYMPIDQQPAIETPRQKLEGTTRERAKKAAEQFMEMGYDKNQAAGMVGSLMQESRLDPNAKNPISGAYGIGQWLGSRVDDFKRVMGRALEGSTLEQQLAFHDWELKNTEVKAGMKIRNAINLQDVVKIHTREFERPGANEEALSNRMANAMETLSALNEVPVKKINIEQTAPPVEKKELVRPGDTLTQNGMTGRPGEKIKPQAPLVKIFNNVHSGRENLAQVDRSPLSVLNAQAIANSAQNQYTRGDTNITVGPVAVHTQAIDADGISKSISDHLGTHLRNAVNQLDDGIMA